MNKPIQSLFDAEHLPDDAQLFASIAQKLPASALAFCFELTGKQVVYINVTSLTKDKSAHIGIKPDAAKHFQQLIASPLCEPMQLTAEQAGLMFNQDALRDAWLIPFAEQSKKWLVIIDEWSEIPAMVAEHLFYFQGWMFSRRELESTRRELAKANRWIEDELEDISQLQQLMLPDKELSIPGVDVAYTYRAMSGAGGDYLDVMDLSKRRESGNHDIGAIVADVTGHGPSAAVEAAMLDAILRTFTPKDDSEGPSQVLNYINQHFFTRKERSRFLTANIFRYLGEEKLLTFANAGHPPGYIKRGKQIIPLDEGGIPIGVVREYRWSSHHFQVHRGDILFIYTDVVIETKNPRGEDFGLERLTDALSSAPSEPNQLLEYVEMQMRVFCECRAFQDDMTMCAIYFD